ncbi:MAG TPA: hypothetical protein PKC55_07330 [Dysgonomonas sp.]|uniref:hypothetical protein n=1 Tax=unclassified Dysgonomonas TaxID=2630389 RepID=UPI0025C232C6|nr:MULTISPECIES: hypothetical protein [unclassified Dysgonomonas]HML64623.1 hypothetical protein [Dysgonomonas sp.]
MKNIKVSLCHCFVLILTVFTFFSCSEDNAPEQKADYNLLGITSVTINGSRIPVKADGVLLDLADSKDIVGTGSLSEPYKKHFEIEYAILTKDLSASSVEIQSKYPDVSIDISHVVTSPSVITWIAKITREGYSESVIYNLSFFDPSLNKMFLE